MKREQNSDNRWKEVDMARHPKDIQPALYGYKPKKDRAGAEHDAYMTRETN